LLTYDILRRGLIAALLAGAAASPAAAQETAPRVQTAAEALAEDAADYARRHGVPQGEALRRLRAQEESVAATDRLQNIYRDRLAGISIEHRPDYRIVFLLTGDSPVPDQTLFAGGMNVPIVFRTGAAATRDALAAAIARHQAELRSAFPAAQGIGVDPRTGEVVLLTKAGDADEITLAEMDSALEAMMGVPVRVRALDRVDTNFGIEGGARVEGIDPANGRRYACTTGFVVTDASQTGIVTAAHCPDTLTYYEPGGGAVELGFVGQWGARYQDVQVHVSERAQQPLFYADARKQVARKLTGSRSRTSTRAGDSVCKRGETTGYSCSEVELVDFAPPGDLCGGPCDPVWVTVTGPSCRAGDSGGPVFVGTTAFGIAKGGNYGRGGRCNFYYYMSTDYLPDGWSLLLAKKEG
jgi:hypothetical protein